MGSRDGSLSTKPRSTNQPDVRVVSTNRRGKPELARALLDLVQQRLAVAFAPEVGMHRERGELARSLLRESIERRAADDHAVVLGDDEALDFHLQALARAAHQDALVLQRLDDRQDAADVVDRRAAQMRERRRPRPSCRRRRA